MFATWLPSTSLELMKKLRKGGSAPGRLLFDSKAPPRDRQKSNGSLYLGVAPKNRAAAFPSLNGFYHS
uniref:Uncharacterized protein n=1 Tax=Chromera velia CCMP2878 TaxID=1169474 RepID=A0A0G4I8C6_9ALVE|eukprot:Cvel_11827.t1-p1 / transcript=Cvel_11827.t1 / gene=Cvel_11827 / organism=Chromera_velia_CCMP2878 / gene_product=hypothetical protein / transcript_product=hypothetical protein / location=Cvel_scaffold753:53784-55327(+) / protein_length=67 / sequence_SO=supercontig / SO=protein_coding / is_pseudo=false